MLRESNTAEAKIYRLKYILAYSVKIIFIICVERSLTSPIHNFEFSGDILFAEEIGSEVDLTTPSCAQESTNVPSCLNILPFVSPRDAPLFGLCISNSNHSSARKGLWNQIV